MRAPQLEEMGVALSLSRFVSAHHRAAQTLKYGLLCLACTLRSAADIVRYVLMVSCSFAALSKMLFFMDLSSLIFLASAQSCTSAIPAYQLSRNSISSTCSSTNVGAVCTAVCNSGYIVSGNNNFTCTAGAWVSNSGSSCGGYNCLGRYENLVPGK